METMEVERRLVGRCTRSILWKGWQESTCQKEDTQVYTFG